MRMRVIIEIDVPTVGRLAFNDMALQHATALAEEFVKGELVYVATEKVEGRETVYADRKAKHGVLP